MIAGLVTVTILSDPSYSQMTEEEKRVLFTEITADAGALAATCDAGSKWTIGFDFMSVGAVSLKMTPEEIAKRRGDKLRVKAIQYASRSNHENCRDAEEKYGPEGDVFKNALVPK